MGVDVGDETWCPLRRLMMGTSFRSRLHKKVQVHKRTISRSLLNKRVYFEVYSRPRPVVFTTTSYMGRVWPVGPSSSTECTVLRRGHYDFRQLVICTQNDMKTKGRT